MWLALTLALALDPADALHSLAFNLGDDGAIVVPVWVEGQGPFRFLLDTGTSQSVITERLARRLTLTVQSRTAMLTPSGRRTVLAVARLHRIAVGAAAAVDLAVTIVPGRSLPAAGQIEGIIGQDVLAQTAYTIDYRRRAIFWGKDDVTPAGVRVPLEMQHGRVLAVLAQPGEPGATLRMVPDSGTDGVVLFARPEQRLPRLTPLDVGVLRTVSGHRLVRRVLLDSLVAGDLRLENLTAVLVPRADGDAPDGDGLLPLHIFSAVTFNVPERFLVIQP